MPSAALRIHDLTGSTSASVERLPERAILPSQSDRKHAARLDRIFATAWDARKAGAFDRSENALESALKIVNREREHSQDSADQPTLDRRKAEICFTLAQHRLERADIGGGETLLREGIDAFPPDMASERWLFSRDAGEILRNYAGLLGNAAAAELAANIVGEAAENLRDDADAQNQAGLSYALLGELTLSAGPIERAITAYEHALAATNELAPGDKAFRHRLQINRAEALWQLAKLEPAKKEALLSRARSLLEETIEALPDGPFRQQDRPRALDNLGLVLREQGQLPDAIAQFEAAAEMWNDDKERVRTLNNLTDTLRLLAAAQFREGRSSEAWAAINKALQVSEQVCAASIETGLRWGYTQHIRGLVLLLAATRLQSDRPDEARGYYQQARTAFSAAQHERRHEWAPTLRAPSSVALGDTYYQWGRLDGDLGHILRAHELYDAALADISDFERRDVEERQRRSLQDCLNIADTKAEETIRLPNSVIIVPHMDRLDYIVARLAELFTSSGLSEAEASAAVAKACQRVGWAELAAKTKPTPVADLKSAVTEMARPVGRSGLPELPAGLEWPTETYSGSPEAKRGGGGIVPYLERVWLPLHQIGVANRPLMRAIDASTTMAISNFERGNNELPTHLHVPSKSDLVTASVSDPEQVRAARRLIRALERQQLRR